MTSRGIGYQVIAWILDRDPYRPGRGIASAVVASYPDACALADVWARTLARFPRAIVEIVPGSSVIDADATDPSDGSE